MEKTSKFSIESVPITVTGDSLPEEIIADVKTSIRDHWEWLNVKASLDFIKTRWNPLHQLAQEKAIGLMEYLVGRTELEKYEVNNFGLKDVSILRTLTLNLKDNYDFNRKVTVILGDPDFVRLPSLPNLEASRSLPFSGSKFEEEVLNRYVAHAQQAGGPPLPYSNVAEFKTYLTTLNLKNDLKSVTDMLTGAKAYFDNWDGKFVTDVAEKLREAFLTVIPECQADFEKAMVDPSTSPSGKIVGEQTADIRLAVTLNELADEAYMVAQRMEQENEKGESFFSTLKKQLFNRHEGILLGPDDYKEEAKKED